MEILLEQLYFTYPSGVNALKNIQLRIQAGEQLAIIGRNGSGKSTLVRHFCGLLRPTSGQVKIGTMLTSEKTPAHLAHYVGMVFQNPDEQICKTTVEREVGFGLEQLGIAAEEKKQRVDEALQEWQLLMVREENPHDLSPAWRRRVILASILALDTPVVVLDEPTMGQDLRFRRELNDLLERLKKEGKTVIVVSHDMDFVADRFERIVVLRQGECVLDGAPEKVFLETERLRECGVMPPQVSRLGQALNFSKPVCRVDDFVEALD